MNLQDLPDRERYDMEQQAIAQLGKAPNVAEWEIYYRKEMERSYQAAEMAQEAFGNG